MLPRLRLLASALGAVLVLWAFYALLVGLVINSVAERASLGVELPWWAGGVAAAWLVAVSLVYPRVLDGMLRPRWIPFEEAGDVGPAVLALLARHGLPAPRLGVVVEPDPLIVTYGMLRSRARIVVSSGLLRSLDVDGQCALFYREVGHLAQGDLAAVTLLATPVALFHRLVEALLRGRQAFAASAGTSGILVAPLLEALTSVHASILAPLARSRAVAADRFALDALRALPGQPAETAPRILSEALGKVAHGLTLPVGSKRDAGSPLAPALRGFMPVDALRAGRIGTWSAREGRGGPERFREALERLGANPFAGTTSWDALHPLEVHRPGIDAAAPSPTPEARARHRACRLAHLLPPLGFAAGVGASLALHGYVGLPLLGWGLARLVFLYLEFIRPRAVTPVADVEDRMREGETPWGESLRVDLEGALVGLGIPGVTRCPDPVVRVGGLFLPVRLRLPFGRLQVFPQQERLLTVIGQKVRAVGILRFRDVPYVELHALHIGRDAFYSSGFVVMHLLLSVLLLLFGSLFVASQGLGV